MPVVVSIPSIPLIFENLHVGRNNFEAQAAQVFKNLNVALYSVGCTAANLVT